MPRALSGGAHAARAAIDFAWQRSRLRIALLSVLLALPLLGGGWLWLRQSSLVAVEHVRITGVHGVGSHQIERALQLQARQMSTLDVHPAALRAAVSQFPQVAAVHASAHFPHSLRISVTEQLPVAVMLVSGQRTAVSANGVVLGSSFASKSLPVIDGSKYPLDRVSEPLAREYLAVLGAAPGSLGKLADRAYSTQKGLTLQMRGGLLVYFGDATRPHAKWLSFARVLSDSSSAGATYIDVRLPERPAAGVNQESSDSAAGQNGSLDPNSAALAETLEGAITGSGATTSAQTAASTPAAAAETQTEPSATETPAIPASTPSEEPTSTSNEG